MSQWVKALAATPDDLNLISGTHMVEKMDYCKLFLHRYTHAYPCIPMYTYIYLCTHKHTCIPMHTHAYPYTHMQTVHTHIYTHVDPCTHMYTYVRACTHTHAHACVCTHTHTHLNGSILVPRGFFHTLALDIKLWSAGHQNAFVSLADTTTLCFFPIIQG